MKKTKLVKFVALATATALLAGCGASSTSSTTAADGVASTSAEGEKILTVRIGPDVETIDPALNSSSDGGNYLLFLSDNLLGWSEDNQIQGALAESWEQSDDALTWTFTLREGLKWSDGSDLTASDFVYSWQRVVDPDLAAPYGETVLGMVAGYEDAIGNPDADGNMTTEPDPTKLQVEATDDRTLVVHLSNPCPYFDKLAAFATLVPVKQEVVEADPEGWAINPETYISTGAFYLAEWVPGSHILFKKNEYYWNADAVKLDGIKALLMQDQNASLSAYESGDALMIKEVPANEITTMQQRDDFYVSPLLGTYYIDLNHWEEIFEDVRVREALSLAIDRKYISETITAGVYTAATSFVGTGVSDWDGSEFRDNANDGQPYIDVDDYEGNLARAKELLAEAGYPDGEGFPTLTYSTNDASYHKAIAEYIQQAWGDLGITLNVEIVEWKSFTPLRRSGEYMVARDGWILDYNDPVNILELQVSTNGNNNSKYSNPDYDALIDKAASETDAQTRYSYLHQAEDLLMEDTAVIPLLYYNDYYLQSDKITGSWHSPYGYFDFRYADITE